MELRTYVHDYRDYQGDASQAALQDPAQRKLIVLPTGTGKSLTLSAILEEALYHEALPVLIVVHKTDLVDQLAGTVRALLPEDQVAVEQSTNVDLSEGKHFKVAVASIQTLLSRPEVVDGTDWKMIVVDETHRILADGYVSIVERLGCFQADGPQLIGFTATDYRSDPKERLSLVYESVPYKRNLKWALGESWLVPLSARQVKVEYKDGSDGEILREELRSKFIETFLEELAVPQTGSPDLYQVRYPTMIMAPSVPAGRQLEDELRKLGINARMIDSLMNPKLRKLYTKQFRSGELDVAISFNLFVEGFDSPHATVLCMLRDTESPVVFVQSIGRILRPYFGSDMAAFQVFNKSREALERQGLIEQSEKPRAYFYDFTAATGRHRHMTLGSALELAPEFDFQGEDVYETLEDIDELLGSNPLISPDAITKKEEIGLLVEDINLFQEAITPNVDVPANATLTYSKHGNSWSLYFPADSKEGHKVSWHVQILQDARGEWQAWASQPEIWKEWYWNGRTYKQKLVLPSRLKTVNLHETMSVRGKKRPRFLRVAGMAPQFLVRADSKEEIFYFVEVWVHQHFPKSYRVAHYDNPWRSETISEAQTFQLKKMSKAGIPLPESLDRGAASMLIDLWKAGVLVAFNPRRRLKGKRNRRGAAKRTAAACAA